MNDNPVRIIELRAENVKRLKAVHITAHPNMQVVSGRNAQGKTSVMDAIWMTLGGGSATKATQRPIRDGEDTARSELDLGDMVVARTWKDGKTSLVVTTKDGFKHPKPQELLDSMVGRFSFDPLAFTRLSAKEQRDALLNLVDLPFDPVEQATERQRLYDERTQIGREVKQAEGALASTTKVEAPAELVSVSELVEQERQGRAANEARDASQVRLSRAAREVERLEAELAEAKRELKEASDVKVPDAVDVDAIREQINNAETINDAVRSNRRHDELNASLEDARSRQQDKTDAITALDKQKAEGLASATFPVEGLGFDDEGVTYQGIPFQQASSAEQIKVSLAMAMALNPKLRVLRIMDGSLLDDESLKIIEQMAVDHDYQVWLEKVGDGGVGVVIEDGEVKA